MRAFMYFSREDFDLRLGVGRRRMGVVGILVDCTDKQVEKLCIPRPPFDVGLSLVLFLISNLQEYTCQY